MRTALGHNNALDKRAAALAWLALLLVHLHVRKIIARLTPQVAILAEGGAAMLNAQRQHRDNTLAQQA